MTENKCYKYGVKLAIIYSLVWFIDLLDASALNVALPAIAASFHIEPTSGEWTIVGFLLSMTIGISISGWLGEKYGLRRIFLLSQLLYIASSIGCAFSLNITMLICFRLFQGFAVGMGIPLGMSALLKTMPQNHWAKTTASMNMITLMAPALGPIFGAYVTTLFGWKWIFLMKLPLSALCLLLTLYWVKNEELEGGRRFDWAGFVYGGISLSGMLWVFSSVGKADPTTLGCVAGISLLFGALFLRTEKLALAPLVPLSIFKIPNFAFGNLIQSAANTIFLGANFLVALYLQQGLGLSLVDAGWIMAAITPGMLVVQPFIGRFYNRVGPLPFIVTGLILLTLTTYAFALTTPETSKYLLGMLVFCVGTASSLAQTANVTSIFSGLPQDYKGVGSSVYALFKQISASFGVALTTMVLTVGSGSNVEPSLAVFHYCFIVLGSIPALALFFCNYISNKEALSQIKAH